MEVANICTDTTIPSRPYDTIGSKASFPMGGGESPITDIELGRSVALRRVSETRKPPPGAPNKISHTTAPARGRPFLLHLPSGFLEYGAGGFLQ